MKSPGANAPWHKQSGEATGVLHVPRDGFWLELRSISVSRDLHRLCLLMSKLKSSVITCYSSDNHHNHQNRASRYLRMFRSKKACPQPAQPESGGQPQIRRSTVCVNSIQYCPKGNEMNAVTFEHLERKKLRRHSASSFAFEGTRFTLKP